MKLGGIYHILNRGVEKRAIFLKNQDYARFVLALEFFNSQENIELWGLFHRTKGKDPHLIAKRIKQWRGKGRQPIVELMAFCLMPNHFHLIIREQQSDGIIRFMRKLGGYANYFNRQCERSGPLFQGRYKAIEVKDIEQLQTLFAYVHANPMELWEPGWKEFKVKNPKQALTKLKEYRWSSWPDYIGKKNFPHVTQRSFFLQCFGGAPGCFNVVKNWVAYKASQMDLNIELLE